MNVVYVWWLENKQMLKLSLNNLTDIRSESKYNSSKILYVKIKGCDEKRSWASTEKSAAFYHFCWLLVSTSWKVQPVDIYKDSIPFLLVNINKLHFPTGPCWPAALFYWSTLTGCTFLLVNLDCRCPPAEKNILPNGIIC